MANLTAIFMITSKVTNMQSFSKTWHQHFASAYTNVDQLTLVVFSTKQFLDWRQNQQSHVAANRM